VCVFRRHRNRIGNTMGPFVPVHRVPNVKDRHYDDRVIVIVMVTVVTIAPSPPPPPPARTLTSGCFSLIAKDTVAILSRG